MRCATRWCAYRATTRRSSSRFISRLDIRYVRSRKSRWKMNVERFTATDIDIDPPMNSVADSSNRRQTFFKILVPLVASGLTLVALELGMALFHPIPFSIESNMYFDADPYTGFRLKPGGVGQFQMGIPAVANSHGHRDVEVAAKKPPGVFRILVLGDSFTVGANVRQEEAYPKVLERRLRSVYGSRIQVVNSGV